MRSSRLSASEVRSSRSGWISRASSGPTCADRHSARAFPRLPRLSSPSSHHISTSLSLSLHSLPHHRRPFTQKKNPLRNAAKMASLNPYAASVKRRAIKIQEKRTAGKVKGSTKKSCVSSLCLSSSPHPPCLTRCFCTQGPLGLGGRRGVPQDPHVRLGGVFDVERTVLFFLLCAMSSPTRERSSPLPFPRVFCVK